MLRPSLHTLESILSPDGHNFSSFNILLTTQQAYHHSGTITSPTTINKDTTSTNILTPGLSFIFTDSYKIASVFHNPLLI